MLGIELFSGFMVHEVEFMNHTCLNVTHHY